MNNMLFPIVALLARLVIVSSVDGVDDLMSYWAISILNCLKSLTSQHCEKVTETQDKLQTQNKEINSLPAYLKLYQPCFQNFWSFCLYKETIEVFDLRGIRKFKPCYVIHVAAYGKAATFVYKITTTPNFR